MSQRLRKIDRVLNVQRQIHKAAEVKLASLQRQGAELKEKQENLIQTMNDQNALHGLFVDTMAKRLHALAAQSARIETAKETQTKITFERAMQVKRTEKLVCNLETESRREEEKKQLMSVLEQHAAGVDASFP